MPVLSDEEMAVLLDPALAQGQQYPAEDDEAVRAQMVANMEQNKLATFMNRLVSPFRQQSKPQDVAESEDPTTTNHTRDQTSLGSQLVDAAAQRHHSAQPTSHRRTAPTANDEVEQDDSAKDAPAPVQDDEEFVEDDAATVNEAVAASEKEEDDYEDASSELDDPELDVATADASDADVETGDVSDATNNDEAVESEDDVDLCMFCGKEQSEGDSAEKDLTCTICRKPAHAACVQPEDVDPEHLNSWRCPNCAKARASESPKGRTSKPRHSASRLVRDLLPVSRGIMKPGAHSIFAQPLIHDDEGGRSLRRKRKSDSLERSTRADKPRKRLRETPESGRVEPELVAHSTRRSSQKLTLSVPAVPTARIIQHRPYHKPPPHKFILAFRLDPEKLEALLAEPPRPHRRKYLKKKQKILAPPPHQPPVPKFPALPTHHLIFPSSFGERDHETNAKPYGGILSETEADTSRSLPQMRDREIFEIARKEAEEERKKTSEKAEAEINNLGEVANAANSKRTVSGPPSKIKCIQFGKHVIDTSYAAPYPEEYSHESRLFICEFCLKYLPSEFVAWRHKLKCPAKHPPGDEIYRDGSLSVWEVDGRKKTEYCQCLCLMAKLFLGSKTLYYDVDPFLFYVLTEYDDFGYHFVGYFSKEKRPASQNNVSCILVMPIHQRKGYATFLIEFSYLLTRLEGKEGSPEKPLSDMGLTAYRSYWDLTISRHLIQLDGKPFSVKEIMFRTGMTADDVVHSLERLYAFVRDPVTKAYGIRYNRTLYAEIVDKYESKEFRQIRAERLVWTPYIMGRSDAATLDAQPITAVAQREDIPQMPTKDFARDVSPKTSEEPSRQSPSTAMIDPALLNDIGNIAPGPPTTDSMTEPQTTAVDLAVIVTTLNGTSDNDKTPDENTLTGYALTYQTEHIPPTRFQIDPPIPSAMLRSAKNKRKSIGGTPRPNGVTRVGSHKPRTPQAVRSSPRKAGSVTGSAGRGSSRVSSRSPDKGSASVRRSGRRSGLANEVVPSDQSNEDEDDEEDEDEDEDEDVEEGDTEGEEDEAEELIVVRSHDEVDADADDASGSEDEESSEASSDDTEGEVEAEVLEEEDASDDPDAEVDEESASSSEEEQEDDAEEGEVDAPSSAAVTEGEETEGD